MKYQSGDVVKVGDIVELWEGCKGEVVCSLDDNEYTVDFNKEEWSYLECGVLVMSEKMGLIHYTALADNMRLISRS